MTAIKTTNIIEGNLAQEPKYFPQGQYVARTSGRTDAPPPWT